MKLPPFDYRAPTSLQEALALLADHPGDARLLAGGQSLIPILAFRLAQPALLIDLRHVPSLNHIDINDTATTLGAMVRWCEIEKSEPLRQAQPLLYDACLHIAHYQIRNRGTVGGSLAHADPAAELPGVAVCCEARIRLSSGQEIAAAEFFTGALQTTLGPEEMILGVVFPVWPAARKWGFAEFARRPGDLAIAGIALFYDFDMAGRARDAHIAVIGATNLPMRLSAAEALLNGADLNEAAIAAVAQAAADSADPPADIHASIAYRKSLVATLVRRALVQAMSR